MWRCKPDKVFLPKFPLVMVFHDSSSNPDKSWTNEQNIQAMSPESTAMAKGRKPWVAEREEGSRAPLCLGSAISWVIPALEGGKRTM